MQITSHTVRQPNELERALRDIKTDLTSLKTAQDSVAASNGVLNTGALAIKTGGSALVKTVNTVYFLLAGVLKSKAAADMAALSGTVVADKFNVYCFYVDASGTLTSSMGTAGDTLAEVVFPVTPSTKALIGFVVINPTGTGNFVGGTTALDDATVVPNAVYVNTVGVFTPTTTAVGTLLTT